MSDLSNRSPEQIQSEIAATRHSLDRKLDELGHRLNPRERIAEVKARASDAVDTARERASGMIDTAREKLSDARERVSDASEKLHPRNLEPYVGWMAVGAVVGGTLMAINGWRRVQLEAAEADNYIVGTDVTIVNTNDLGDLPPAP